MNSGAKKYRMQGKNTAHRNAIIRAQVLDLIIHGRIKTTVSKAKILKAQFDHLVSVSRRNSEASKNVIKSFFTTADGFARFTRLTSKLEQDKVSGFTKLVKTTARAGDNANQAYVIVTALAGEDKSKGKDEIAKVLEKQRTSKSKKPKQVKEK